MTLWGKDGYIYANPGGNVPFDATRQELEDCCCDEGPENTCNSCDPPIPDTLYVTFPADLTGDFAPYAGNTYELNWEEGCTWEANDIENAVDGTFLFPGATIGTWGIALFPNDTSSCYVEWQSDTVSRCEPDTLTYGPFDCTAISCDDTTSCDDGPFGSPSISET